MNPVTAARQVLAEFEQAMGDGGGEHLHPGIWRYWCTRLAVAVEAVVTEPGPSRRGFLLGRFRPPASMPPPVAVPPAPGLSRPLTAARGSAAVTCSGSGCTAGRKRVH